MTFHLDQRYRAVTNWGAGGTITQNNGGGAGGTVSYRLVDPGWEDPEDGGAGVREPRRPRLPTAPAAAMAEIPT